MTEDILTAIQSEIDYQNKKWGYGPEHKHTLIEWLTIIEKLVEKAKNEWYDGFENPEAIASLRKIAATAIQGMIICGFSNRVDKNLPRSTEDIMKSIRLKNEER